MAEKFEYTRTWLDAEAFPRLGFTRSWENPEDYPTVELEEAKVRQDMQSLHDETKDYINEKLIPAVLAADSTEAARTAAEEARATAEESRSEAEEARVSAETVREEAEEAREDAESSRAEAELGRASAEAARAAAESQRASAEETRATAEAARVTAEQGRASAEAARVQAESARADAEQGRVSAETARAAAEQARADAEQQRVSAEDARAASESARNRWEDYDPSHTYVPGNKVAFNGSSYLNTASCTGIAPPDQGHWLLIAERGQNGTGVGDFLADGSVPMTGDLQMGGNRIADVGEPQAGGDAVPKSYADAKAPLLVTVSGDDTDGYTADHTACEVYQAAQDDREVFARIVRSESGGWEYFALERTSFDGVPLGGSYACRFWKRQDGQGGAVSVIDLAYTEDPSGDGGTGTVSRKLLPLTIPVRSQDPADAEDGEIWVVSET